MKIIVQNSLQYVDIRHYRFETISKTLFNA